MSNLSEVPTADLTEEQISANRMEWVHEQIVDFRRGFIKSIRCPYCKAFNKPDTEFCCPKMLRAVGAVCDRIDLAERQEEAAKIVDRIN